MGLSCGVITPEKGRLRMVIGGKLGGVEGRGINTNVERPTSNVERRRTEKTRNERER
jgi:hypothetical protein